MQCNRYAHICARFPGVRCGSLKEDNANISGGQRIYLLGCSHQRSWWFCNLGEEGGYCLTQQLSEALRFLNSALLNVLRKKKADTFTFESVTNSYSCDIESWYKTVVGSPSLWRID